MDQQLKVPSRKRFLLWSAVLLSSFTVLKFISGNKTKKNETGNKTVKMLTQNGKLVEIDKTLLTSEGKKITDEDLKTWVKK
jgi:hypothetical protein